MVNAIEKDERNEWAKEWVSGVWTPFLLTEEQKGFTLL